MSSCLIINPFSSLLANNPDIYCPYYCLTCWYLVWAGPASSDVIASLISPVQVISTRGHHNTSKNVFSWRWNAHFTSDNGACLSRWDYQRFSTTSSTPSKNKSYMEPTALIGGIRWKSGELSRGSRRQMKCQRTWIVVIRDSPVTVSKVSSPYKSRI